jgi:hypothetical protein
LLAVKVPPVAADGVIVEVEPTIVWSCDFVDSFTQREIVALQLLSQMSGLFWTVNLLVPSNKAAFTIFPVVDVTVLSELVWLSP